MRTAQSCRPIIVNILNNFILVQNKTYVLSPNQDFHYNVSIQGCPITMNNNGWVIFFVLYVFKYLLIAMILP